VKSNFLKREKEDYPQQEELNKQSKKVIEADVDTTVGV